MHRSKSMLLVAFVLVAVMIASGVTATVWAQSGVGTAGRIAPQSIVLDLGAQPSAAPSQVAPPPPSISPSSVEVTLLPSASARIAKTVQTATVPPSPDIVFLADTTASMGDFIAGVQAGIGQIMAAMPPTAAFGVASYKDFCSPGNPPAYSLASPVTTNTATVSAAVATWVAGGGCDLPEAQLNALHELATNPATGWRTPLSDHSRIIVWFGDQPGHDPSNGQTQASVISELTPPGPNATIRVIAISVGANHLDGNCTVTPCIFPGQATAITAATGGSLHSGVNASVIVAEIIAALTTLPMTVSMTSNCTAPVTTTFSPASITVISGGIAAFTEIISVAAGAASGDYSCDDWALIGGVPMTDAAGNIIKERKLIHVKAPPPPTTTYIYSVKIVCGTVTPPRPKPSIPTLRDPAPVVPGLYRTAVNIHNFWEKETTFLQKVAIALPQDKERGPVTKKIQTSLRSNEAIEVDCYNVVAILEGTTAAKSEFLKGFVVIESPVELEVTAVYTAEELQENGISIDVEQIQPHVIRPSEVVRPGDGRVPTAPEPTATRTPPPTSTTGGAGLVQAPRSP